LTEKLKIALYWAASCGGCEIAVLDINEKILELVNIADILFWPVAIDTKYHDLERLENESIDVCLFNGGIRNSENEHIAKLLRKKSKLLIAFGTCACSGSIPGLANLSTREEILETAYVSTISTENKPRIYPKTRTLVPEGELTLPSLNDTLKTLDQIVRVDYFLPGCPPPVSLIAGAIDALAKGNLPPRGSVLAPLTAVCHECTREKNDKSITKFLRPYEITADPTKCFLDQGIICMGIATRSGCGAQCLKANWPCTGCGGVTPDALDQGMKMVSAIASMTGLKDEETLTEEGIGDLFGQIKDLAGTFYMYSLAGSQLRRRIKK